MTAENKRENVRTEPSHKWKNLGGYNYPTMLGWVYGTHFACKECGINLYDETIGMRVFYGHPDENLDWALTTKSCEETLDALAEEKP